MLSWLMGHFVDLYLVEWRFPFESKIERESDRERFVFAELSNEVNGSIFDKIEIFELFDFLKT